MGRQLPLSDFLEYSDSPVIDLRTETEFSACHLVDSTHVQIDDIIDRMYELPKRDKPLRLCGSAHSIAAASKLLGEKGYRIEATLDWDKLQQPQLESNLFESGSHSVQLWSPAPVVRYFNECLESNFHHQKSIVESEQQEPRAAPTALDLACGSGRDAVYLAQNGWKVTAIDYLAGALTKTRDLAQRNNVSVETLQLDLELESFDLTSLERTFDMIQVIRYLHRPLLTAIKSLINPDGYIVYQTFMEGCEKYGKPKNPRFILKEGELSRVFSGFKVLVDKVELLEDGRPTNIFIAQKTKN